MKIKAWKYWLLVGIFFLFASVMDLIDKAYSKGLTYVFLGLIYIGLSIITYKNNNKSNQIEGSDTVMTDVDNYLMQKAKKLKHLNTVERLQGLILKKPKNMLI